MFKSAMSVAANIVEGRSHTSEKEFARFLGYALHSSTELEHHLIVGRDIEVISEADFVSFGKPNNHSTKDALWPFGVSVGVENRYSAPRC
jgi:four helix bundle protein